nr:hypothetical protein [Tanacetum cinerariifolium]
TQTIQTPEQHKWLTKLLGYDFEIHYKLGKENKVADALSRPKQSTLMALSSPKATWLNEIRAYYRDNPQGQKLIEQLENNSLSLPHHTLHNDLVYLRLRNYRQTFVAARANQKLSKRYFGPYHILEKIGPTSVAARANQKLSKRYFGPYRILEKIGPVAYRLQLPITSRVHPVFHVSLLKESHNQSISTEFPSEWLTDYQADNPEPERILEQRNSGNKKEVLIQWKNQEVPDATWEDLQEITIQFPEFVGHEDESAVEREEIDTSHPATQAQPSTAQQDPRPKRVIRKPNRFLD